MSKRARHQSIAVLFVPVLFGLVSNAAASEVRDAMETITSEELVRHIETPLFR